MTTPPVQTFPPLLDLGAVPTGPVLVVAPHPDDEIIGCGGAIALHGRRGDPVHVVLVTGGEAGGLAGERLDESRAAAAELGHSEVSCLGAPDGAVASDHGLSSRLGEVVDRVAPAVVYAPSPFEMHPDHVASLHAVQAALAGRAPEPALLLYEVNAETMASFLLDITPVWESKRRALTRFASQIGLIDVVSKVDARNRARTVNVDLPAVTHAEGYTRVDVATLAGVWDHLARLAAHLGLAAAAWSDPPG